uniref:MSP domain-containing protein n=1 Tax=Chlamydomonas leiostraca TaxID=1034604 RepID=A0A7S0WWL3_9CHLO|mmetsp:Transcript_32700/g.82967  ORF Transcript_32700/g.82967 Transcript_32700/m.82967 type:complete len:243 (+) Transcript_32700:68-796(+)|eukprot:CAMPEP_0202868018 /NCGR_PEP_ID=MMETSP1391-20130828/9994_1 /ASSEMBLY_ACC=CAM_ASM_000867 /TAXON_ID=1034604 /ORGANISM="Chlamydomonas leiostraca, Strain SAG 11-49" /LENGTH=242 /DNA_ID=CAMNT_0049548115 /DNA_START=51 /DNA_END=779 /DNA_ORIENTATION=+
MAATDVEIQPADLRFRFALNKQLLATITINNPLSSRVAFKIKTTAPKKYVVRPSSGVAEPRSSVSVQVIMQAQKDYPADFQNCKDKFMVQTTTLADEEQIDKDTFSKEVRKDLRESRLRVVMEGPAAPPSPVPEANEGDGDEARAASTGDAAGAPESSRLKTTLNDLSVVSSENTSLKVQLDKLTKERDELRRKLDFIELQGASGNASKGQGTAIDPALKFRVTIVHIILVAIIAFLIGHYT